MTTRKLRVLVVDDEEAARRKTLRFLGRFPEPMTVLEAASGTEAVRQIEAGAVDLVLLDIQMPDMTGFQVIEAIGVEAMPPVIFLTAWDQYAVNAFEVEAVDYLLKPFDFERFRRAFRRAVQQAHNPERDFDGLLSLLGQMRSQQPSARLLVRQGDRFVFVRIDEIQALAAADKYVEVLTEDQVSVIREPLASLEGRLPSDRFARVHRSFIVNLDAVSEISPWAHGDYMIRLRNGKTVPLSRRYAAAILAR